MRRLREFDLVASIREPRHSCLCVAAGRQNTVRDSSALAGFFHQNAACLISGFNSSDVIQ